MTLPAFAAERRRLQEILTDSWYAAQAPAATEQQLLPQGTQQQTSHTLLLLSINATDKQTDKWVDQGGYIFYAGGSIAGVSCRRRWPPPTTLALTTLVAQCELSGR